MEATPPKGWRIGELAKNLTRDSHQHPQTLSRTSPSHRHLANPLANWQSRDTGPTRQGGWPWMSCVTRIEQNFGPQLEQTFALGEYDFELEHDEVGRLWVDGLLLRQMAAGQPAAYTLPLAAGRHAVRVDYWHAGAPARCVLRWRPPGAMAFEVVPASAFVTQ